MDQKLNKWLRWLKVVENDIQQMLIHRNIFWEVQKIIRKNRNIQQPSSFYQYLGVTYVSYITMGIRRQVKIDKQSISFARLLSEIIETPSILSRVYFRSLYKGSVAEDLADRDFDKFVENGPFLKERNIDFISSTMVCNDLNELKTTAVKVEEFGDKIIAHRDSKAPKTLPTFDNVDECLDFMDKLYVKYHLLFHAAGMETLMPVYQYDWTEIFLEPWLHPETELHDY